MNMIQPNHSPIVPVWFFWTKLFHGASERTAVVLEGIGNSFKKLPSSLIWNFKMSLWGRNQELVVLRWKKLPSISASNLSTLLLRGAKKNKWWDQVGGLDSCSLRLKFCKTYVKISFLQLVCIHPYVSVGTKEKRRHFAGLYTYICIYIYKCILYLFYLTVFVLFHINLTIFSSKQICVHAIKTTHF